MPVKVVERERTLTEALLDTAPVRGVKVVFKAALKFYLVIIAAMLPAAAAEGVFGGGLVGSIAMLLAFGGTVVFFYRGRLRAFRHGRNAVGPPSSTVALEGWSSRGSVVPEAPPGLYIGERLDAEGGRIVLTSSVQARHTYILGKSGTGKTTLLKRLIIQEMERGHGIAFVDPHGDAARDLLNYVPKPRVRDVVYFDPTSETCPHFNPLTLGVDPAKLQADLLSAFKMFFSDSWGFRLEFCLSRALLTLITDEEPHSFADLHRLLIHDDYREPIVARTQNAQLRDFWTREWKTARQSVPAISNKLGQFLTPTSPLERLFSQPDNDLDFATIMNEGKIFIANLAKGQIGDDPAYLVGGLIATGIQQSALARSAIPETDRRPFALYVDEFQNYVVASFATILSEARKYKLSLTLAHQTVGQIPSALYDAITGNVATIVAFAVSADDARRLGKEMHKRRVLVRPRESTADFTLAEFIDYQKGRYRKALEDKELGMSREEVKRYDAQFDTWSGAFEASRFYNARRDEIERTLDLLDRPELNLSLLRELFGSDFEFRDESFPNVDEFLNLPPHHGICRLERAENVFPFRAPLPPPPTPEVSALIFARQREQTRPPAAPDAAPEPPPAPPPAPPPKDEDFNFRF